MTLVVLKSPETVAEDEEQVRSIREWERRHPRRVLREDTGQLLRAAIRGLIIGAAIFGALLLLW